MIQNEFEYLGRTVAKAMRKRNARFIVQTFDHAAVILAFGVEIVEQEILVGAEHASDLFHGFEPGAQGAGGPSFQIGRRPGGAAIEPEAPEAFLEFPCARRGPERSENRVEFGPGLSANFARSSQEQEASALGAGALLFGAQAGLLAPAHLIERLVEVFGDVEGVENVERVLTHGGDHVEERFPHVAANHFDAIEESGVLGFKRPEALAQGGLSAAHADMEQTARTGIDLIDKGQEIGTLFTTASVEFVHPEGGDAREVAVFESPVHDPLHRTKDRIPTGVENGGGRFPGQVSSPAGEENHVGFGIRTLATTPGHGLHGRCSGGRTDHAARRVGQFNQDVPNRHEVPTSFGQFVMHAPGLEAAGATALAARVGIKHHLDARLLLVEEIVDGLHDKTSKVLHVTEKCFNGELNGGCGVVCCFATPSNTRGRHSQACCSQQAQRVLLGKTHAGLFAEPVAAVKRAGDINPGQIQSLPKQHEFYATRSLDGGEERALR